MSALGFTLDSGTRCRLVVHADGLGNASDATVEHIVIAMRRAKAEDIAALAGALHAELARRARLANGVADAMAKSLSSEDPLAKNTLYAINSIREALQGER